MDQQHTPPTLAEVQGTLDELAAAARAGEADRYRAALRVAARRDLTEEQLSDAYRWGLPPDRRVGAVERRLRRHGRAERGVSAVAIHTRRSRWSDRDRELEAPDDVLQACTDLGAAVMAGTYTGDLEALLQVEVMQIA